MSVASRSGRPRHILVTGASSGLGAALARLYAGADTTLSLIGRNSERLLQVADDCRRSGAACATALLDVADAAGMERWLRARDREQPFDLVIANAGVGGIDVVAPDSGESGELARRIVEVNLVGVVNTLTPLLPAMVARRSGQVAVVSSLAAYLGLPDAPAYSASKAAVRIYAAALRRRLAHHGVLVSVICPGFVDSPMSATLSIPPYLVWSTERAARHIAARLARGRREIVFPWSLWLAVRIADLLPARLADAVLVRTSLYSRNDG